MKTAKLRVQKCTFASCTIRLIIYEVKGTVFVPVQHRPLYVRLSEISDKKDLSVWIEEPLKLERNHKYYIGVAVMASSGNGEIHFPAYFKKGCVRNLCTDRKKNLPVTLGVSLYGISAKHSVIPHTLTFLFVWGTMCLNFMHFACFYSFISFMFCRIIGIQLLHLLLCCFRQGRYLFLMQKSVMAVADSLGVEESGLMDCFFSTYSFSVIYIVPVITWMSC